MATKVHMEALSPTMEEGQIVKWVKSEGDEVSNGDILAEIETDKATMELVARGDGVLRAVLLGEGDTAPVGAVIGVIAAADEDIDAIVADAGGSAGASSDDSPAAPADEEPSSPEPEAAASEAGAEAPKSKSDQEMDAPVASTGRVKASPLARRLAEEAGIDLAIVSGSGPGGRIVKADVEEAAAAPPAVAAPAAAPAATPAASAPARQTPPPADWSDAGATEAHEDARQVDARAQVVRRAC